MGDDLRLVLVVGNVWMMGRDRVAGLRIYCELCVFDDVLSIMSGG